MTPSLTASSPFKRFDVFYRQYASLFQVATGALLVAVSVFLVVIALIVFRQQSNESTQRHAEAKTVRLSCTRSRKFGPPLIDFLERAESKLRVDALPPAVIVYYRSTIPKSCPR